MLVYKYVNNVNGKVYIGQTTRTLAERHKEHLRHKKTAFDKALSKYGADAFTCEALCECETLDALNEAEKHYIKLYNSMIPFGYNMCEGGDNTKGYTHNDETKRKMSAAKKGKYLGSDNPFYSKTHSDETKEKLSKARKGRTLNSEWRENLAKGHYKKVLCVETGTVYNSINECAETLGLKATHITRVCKGKRQTTGGYHWRYAT